MDDVSCVMTPDEFEKTKSTFMSVVGLISTELEAAKSVDTVEKQGRRETLKAFLEFIAN